ncbi:hypothetical protein [Nocardia brasiliensis]|uniref:hypothetical protein n=1 Tax=Nocardia brasiliensis TaxID=37326 RepID=UPI00245572CA|nr:hypothetical protein [Nocardia brasiliensis]
MGGSAEGRARLSAGGASGAQPAPPRLAVFDATGNPIVVHQLSAPLSAESTTTRIGSAYLVFTGNSVIALNGTTFDPLWTAAGALGSPAMMAGRLLLPTAGAMAFLDPASGAEVGRVPLTRTDYSGAPISLAVLGSTILEQRGTEVYALG